MSDKLELIPVEDIKVTKGMTVDQMLKAMGRAGGFTAQKLADATDIAEAMVKKEGCLRILSFPACIMATGTRGVIVDMVKNDMVDLIITTCGTLDHDLSRTFAHYYKGGPRPVQDLRPVLQGRLHDGRRHAQGRVRDQQAR